MTDDYALRVPYNYYTSTEMFEWERKNLFRGSYWFYLALEADLPEIGSLFTSYVGDIPVFLWRTDHGFHGYVNQCRHRGCPLVENDTSHAEGHVTCPYHHWRYDGEGRLVSVPFQNGIGGIGGLPPEFVFADHGLIPVRLASRAGVIFGTLGRSTSELADYLGETVCEHIDRMMGAEVEVIGRYRQRINANWKLFADNLRDMNHGGLLHSFQVAFDIARVSAAGGIRLDPSGLHNLAFNVGVDHESGPEEYRRSWSGHTTLRLEDPRVTAVISEKRIPYRASTLAAFPDFVIHQVGNSLATRKLVPLSHRTFDIIWTYFGYTSDSNALREQRVFNSNMTGPAGYVSLEDGAVLERLQRTIEAAEGRSCVVIGGSATPAGQDTLVTEAPMRAMWHQILRAREQG
jgi:phenylpropionate dioxygenase-like ring-hydroxylating dioxygenase large terminal subunit